MLQGTFGHSLARAIAETFVPTSPATATWSYYPDDQPQNSVLGVALTAAQRYDGNSRLAHWEAHSTAGATRPLNQSVDYGYAPTGWTTGVTTTGGIGPGAQSDSHDPQGRLISAQGPGAATGSWAYDKDGNLTQAVSSGVTTTYGYTGTSSYPLPGTWKSGELLWTQAGSATPTVYGYDGSGHTTAISTTSGYSLTLGYDPQGRPSGTHLQQGALQVTQTQSYNASGLRSTYALNRTGVTPLTLSEAFIYRGGQLGSLVSISNSVVTTDTFVYAQNGLPLELLHHLAGSATVRYWYVLDGHNNVVALTDSSGNVVDSYTYDAWGKPLSVNEQVAQPYRYASYWYDTELGWYWLSVRHYSPSLERWLQPDPSLQDGTLSYVYVGDDPVDGTDPSGLACDESISPTGVAQPNVGCGEPCGGGGGPIDAGPPPPEGNPSSGQGNPEPGRGNNASDEEVAGGVKQNRAGGIHLFSNLYGDTPARPAPIVRLEQKGGKWITVGPHGTGTASGKYTFVVLRNRIFVQKTSRGTFGHTELAVNQPVEYAGEVRFTSSPSNRGLLKQWSNRSGHYKPWRSRAWQAAEAGLPLNRFVPDPLSPLR